MSSTYNNTKELRFWCQKVLPLVYDDSLSYYELLNKIVVYLNSTIEDVQAMIADVTRIEQGLSSKIDLSQKGVANGVATLNGQGQVPLTQLPDISAGVQTISVNGVNVPADANKNVNIIVMTNAVSNLVNYYLKSETYNKTEVNALIDSVKNSRFEVVTQLPTTDIQTNVIYLVPKSVGQTQNGYDEFINLDGTTSGWELIGSTDIDLSGYVTDSELATALSAYVTTQSLNTTLAGYVTSGALDTTLEGYVTQLSFQSLQNTVTSQGNTLAGLITTVNGKVDKVTGKGLSTNDYSNADKAKVASAVQWSDAEGYVGKNKLKYNAWTKTGVRNGTMVFENNGVTLTATDDDCYTGYDDNFSFPHDARIPVEEGKQIIFSWDINDNDGAGTVIIFPNGGYDGRVSVANTTKQAVYTPTSGITFVTFRLGVATNGNTVHYKDLMFRSADTPSNFVKSIPDNTELFPRSEQAILGAKNGFNYEAWKSVTIFNGTGVFENNGITLTATSADAYTSHSPAGGYPADAIMKVKTGDKISIVWDIDSNDPTGLVYLFKYQGSTSKGNINVSASTKRIDYTVEANVDSITIRFGVTDSGNTIHYKNIMCILQSDTDLTYAPYAMTNRELTKFASHTKTILLGANSSYTFRLPEAVSNDNIHACFLALMSSTGSAEVNVLAGYKISNSVGNIKTIAGSATGTFDTTTGEFTINADGPQRTLTIISNSEIM